MIQVTGLTKDYGERRALHSISFDASAGFSCGKLLVFPFQPAIIAGVGI